VVTERDSRLTVRLTNEHRVITRDLGRLRASPGKLEVGDRSTEAMLFTQLAESLNEHFRIEEQLLFPLLSRSLGSDICDRLNNEHAEILSIAKKMSVQTRPLEESLSHMEQLFRAHISTEENVLFWYLDLQQSTE
jgi:hemerythrin-like domain-containing protein